MTDNLIVTCPSCGAPMVERVNSLNRSTFLRCSRYPDCRETQPIPAYVEVKRAGGIEFPGFGSQEEEDDYQA